MRRAHALMAACAIVALHNSASAQEPSAEAIFRRAADAMRARRYDDAITLFLDSYRRDPAPNALFNVALAHRNLGRPRLALEFFERYLDEAANNVPDDRRAALNNLLSELRAQLVVFVVRLTPADAALSVDGIRMWPRHGELVLDPGEHRFAATAPGYRPMEATRQTRAGESGPLVIALAPDRPLPGADIASPVAAPVGEPSSPHRVAPPLYTRWWLWAGVALVVAGGITTAVLLSTPSTVERFPASVQIDTLVERGSR